MPTAPPPLPRDFFRRPSYWWASRCDWIWVTVSMVTVTTIRIEVPPMIWVVGLPLMIASGTRQTKAM